MKEIYIGMRLVCWSFNGAKRSQYKPHPALKPDAISLEDLHTQGGMAKSERRDEE